MKERRFTVVHALRGLAALWVVLFHVSEAGHIANLRAELLHPMVLKGFDELIREALGRDIQHSRVGVTLE